MKSKTKLLLVSLLLLPGCSMFAKPTHGPVLLSTVRQTPLEMEQVQKTISREELNAALSHEDTLNRARFVQLFTSAGGPANGYPEYRVFDVQPGSIYAMLGISDADVLVGANDYVIFNPRQFKDFVKVLPQLDEASIELRRMQKPMLYKFTITGPKQQ